MSDSFPTFNYSPEEIRLAIIAAPFAAAGQSNAAALDSAESLLMASSAKLRNDAKWHEENHPYAPVNLTTLKGLVKVTPKTLKSYVLEAAGFLEDLTPEEKKKCGQKLWSELLEGKNALHYEELTQILTLRKQRYAASRKKRKK